MDISGSFLDTTLSSGKISRLRLYIGNRLLTMTFNSKRPDVSRVN